MTFILATDIRVIVIGFETNTNSLESLTSTAYLLHDAFVVTVSTYDHLVAHLKYLSDLLPTCKGLLNN